MLNTIPTDTLFAGRSLITLPTCHSTNDYTLNLIAEKVVPEGTVIITHNQTHGKGQRGNKWDSHPGKNLTFSIVFYPGFLPVHKQFYLNIITSLAVHQTLTNFIEKKISVKWPNDILIENRKICGILIQNTIKGKSIAATVIGIGLNVNQQNFDLPTATSCFIETKKEFPLEIILGNLLENLEKNYLLLKAEKTDLLKKLYLDNLYRLNELHVFQAGSLFEGKITGVSEAGMLQILTREELKEFNFKEVAFVH